ncbi:hypothetical protein KC19_8G131300 [Ceratodon purpureus]|uniref:Uncharacterized protein n=1 Tax=Ceratodon purpureus TaxID=3225 RepID=A0A8T0H050_CERPU|nr:hypothetical protein KC19_8G131300 [Ceratodon purpureus]
MHREDLEYSSDYGTDSLRVDRFGGAPSLLESAIRVYELGVLGPRHVCIEFCDCSSCRKLRWFNNPKCNCALGKMWGKYFTLDGAMRVKWLRCRWQYTLVIGDVGLSILQVSFTTPYAGIQSVGR